MSHFHCSWWMLLFALLLACSVDPDTTIADDAAATTITGRIVDENGNPVAGALVEFHRWSDVAAEATSDEKGRISVSVPAGSSWLIAQCEHGERLGYQQIGEVADDIELELVLNPARMIEVATALDGQPVADVVVEVHAGSRPVAAGLTDAEGKCRLAFPRDAFVQTVLAFKSGVGFCGYMRDDDYQSLESDNTPDEYTFELLPAGRITARVQDRLRRPLAGVTVYASSIQWPEEHISFGATTSVHLTTDENGEAVFDFLPEDVWHISFGAIVGEDYHLVSGASWRPGAGNLVEFEAWLKAPVSGTVFNIDGTPAANVPLSIEGDLGSWVGLLSAEGELLDSMRFQGDGMGIVGAEATELFYMISLYGPGVTQDELTAWREGFLSMPPFGNLE